MRFTLALCAVLIASAAYAKEPKADQTGKLLQVDSVPCGPAKAHANNLADEMSAVNLGNSSGNGAQRGPCHEYVLQADEMIYHIRPRDRKRSVLLPVGDLAQFRLEKNRMKLRVVDRDNIEREYVVVSVTPRNQSSTADARPVRLNHLQ